MKTVKRQAKKSFFILLLILLISGICGTAEARSVYAITDHVPGTIKAYQIQGSQLGPPYAQAAFPEHAIDVTVDSHLKLLFLTLEGYGYIVCADANTLAQKGSLATPYMAGIVTDEVKQKVYAVERETDQLYVCKWDGNELVLINVVTLANLGGQGGLGIALDKMARRLYVANDTNTVHYYDVDDPNWAHLGSRNVGHAAMDIDVDSYRGYLYIGGYQEFTSGYTYLVKHNLKADANSNTEQDIGTAAIGLAVDPASGLVYVTTLSNEIRVYDCSSYPFIQTYSVGTGGTQSGPAGICVESAPGPVELTKVDDVNAGGCVGPGDEINYRIDYNYPMEPNIGDINDVNIIDYLPDEVDLVTSDFDGNIFFDFDDLAILASAWLSREGEVSWNPTCNIFEPGDNIINFLDFAVFAESWLSASGVYYPGPPRIVIWNIGTLHPGDSGFVTLKVKVKGSVSTCERIRNTCELRSGEEILRSAYEYMPVCWASDPRPSCGATDVPVDVNVSWRPGPCAERHDVYFGTDYAAVRDANDPNALPGRGRQDFNSFDPCTGLLKLDTTYYWRVDEVNSSGLPQWKGDVWSFTTSKCAVVDNFNSYTGSAALRAVWNVNGTRAQVFIWQGINDASLVRDVNSMRYYFENTVDPYYSEATATIGTGVGKLNIDPNWIGMGAKALVLWFYGQPDNDATKPMYVTLTDSASNSATVNYPPSKMNDIRDPSWHEWNIALTEFTGVNLANVKTITISFGDKTEGAGVGTVYFEDIEVCAPRCVLLKRSGDFAKVDYAPLDLSGVRGGDCVVDYQELEIMAGDWLAQDSTRDTNNPGTANLVAYYPFNEGDGNTTINYAPITPTNANSTPAYLSPKNGDIRERPVTWVTPGPIGDYAIHFDGGPGARVSCGHWAPTLRTQPMTVAIWAKWAGPRISGPFACDKSQGLISMRRGWYESTTGTYFMFEVDTTPAPRGSFSLRQFNSDYSVWSPANILDSFIGKWVHLAATVDGNTIYDVNGYYHSRCRLYLNGAQVQTGTFAFGKGDPNQIELTIGQISDVNEQGVESFNGDLDEARIYNRALTQAEVAYLADIPSPAELYKEEPEGQRVVNFKDFAILANYWLEEGMWP